MTLFLHYFTTMIYKKIILTLVLTLCLWLWSIYAALPPVWPNSSDVAQAGPGADIDGWDNGGNAGNAANCDIGPGWFWNQDLCAAPGVPTVESKTYTQTDFESDANGGGRSALVWAKRAINRVLGLLALIALIILIIQWVLMLVNARDSKKIEEWYTTVKNVAIALIFIGVSWLIVSFIFRAIGVFTT